MEGLWIGADPKTLICTGPAVSEVMINGPNQIYIEKKGQLELVPAKFESREALTAALRNMAQFVGKHVDEFRPILEGRLPDGSRVEAVLPPALRVNR